MEIKYRVVSGSMEPLIQIGSELILERVKIEDIKKFDILVFTEAPIYICHYVWHVNKTFNKGEITTRSLKEGHFDDAFSFDRVLGRVVNYKIGFYMKCRILLGLI